MSLGHFEVTTGRVVDLKTFAEANILIKFITVSGCRLQGAVAANFNGIDKINAGDVVGIEYFQKADIELVKIENIVKLDREVIFESNK